MNAKIIGQKYDEKQDICIVSKYLSTKYLLVTERKIEQWRNPIDITLSKCSKSTWPDKTGLCVSPDVMH